jgi:hypothetical protein
LTAAEVDARSADCRALFVDVIADGTKHHAQGGLGAWAQRCENRETGRRHGYAIQTPVAKTAM